jgi:hypothetical protein
MALLLTACSERLTEYYPKYQDTVKHGAIKHGWIPGIVPATATAIQEQHNLDTNNVWIRFTIPGSDKAQFTTGLKRLSGAEVRKVSVRHPSKAYWWFEGFIQQSQANDNGLNVEIYIVKCRGLAAGGCERQAPLYRKI